VSIEVRSTTADETARPAPPTSSVVRKGRGTTQAAARRMRKVVTTFAKESRIPMPASPDSGDPDEETLEPEPQTSPPPPVAKIDEQPVAPPTSAPVIAPDTARALRVYETYPMLLAQASRTRFEIVVEVCVSDHGQVSDAVIAEGGMAAIDHTLRTAIRSWRYRPLLVNGAPTPFCHFMRIKYAMN
jgi:TonB family protein